MKASVERMIDIYHQQLLSREHLYKLDTPYLVVVIIVVMSVKAHGIYLHIEILNRMIIIRGIHRMLLITVVQSVEIIHILELKT